MILLLAATSQGAETWVVGPFSGPGVDFTSIQAAADSASPGDTVVVNSGTYREEVRLEKALVLRGVDTGDGRPVVKALGRGSAVFLLAGGCTVERLAITNDGSGAGVEAAPGSEGNTVRENDVLVGKGSPGACGVLLSSGGNLVAENTITMEGGTGCGLCLISSPENRISGNSVKGGYYGMTLSSSGKNRIENNEFDGEFYGAFFADSKENLLAGNLIRGGQYGVFVSSLSSDNSIENNAIRGGYFGVCLSSSENNTLKENAVTGGYYGLSLSSSGRNAIEDNEIRADHGLYALYLFSSKDNRIKGNDVSGKRCGIYLISSDRNVVVRNNATGGDYGVYLAMSGENTLYLNNFLGLAASSGSSNEWGSPGMVAYRYWGREAKGHLGNYYYGYQGRDLDGDGIGDMPHQFGEDDPRPLMAPWPYRDSSLYIRGVKFHDLYGDGVRNGTDPGLSGWEIGLTLPSGEVVTTITGNDGGYLFDLLYPGDYFLEEVEVPGWSPTTPNPRQITLVDSEATSEDFGSRGGRRIAGTVFYDLDGDGVEDPGEAALPGVVVQLEPGSSPHGSGLLLERTGGDGGYAFQAPPGAYRVFGTTVSGWSVTLPAGGCHDVNVSASDVAGMDFGYTGLTSVTGVAFNDLDGDGTRDEDGVRDEDGARAEEPGLAGWVIGIVESTGTALGSVRTDQDGAYRFQVPGGSYRICGLPPSGWKGTCPMTSCHEVTVSGSDVAGKDLGYRGAYRITGTIFNDLDEDGLRDGEDLPMAAWDALLTDPSGKPLQTARSDGVGAYSFNVPLGRYRVTATLQPGWTVTKGSYEVVVSGSDVPGRDLGYRGMYTITGTVFQDSNESGIRDRGDKPLEGWQVFLNDTSGRPLQVARTNETGCYKFHVAWGTYRVDGAAGRGWQAVRPECGFYEVTLSDDTVEDLEEDLLEDLVVDGLDFANTPMPSAKRMGERPAHNPPRPKGERIRVG